MQNTGNTKHDKVIGMTINPIAEAKLLVYAISRIPFSNVYSLESLNFVVFLRINRLVFDRVYLEHGNWKELAVANLSYSIVHIT